MTILAVDTTTRSCSAAVVSESGLLAEITLDNDQTHARHLMKIVDQVLELAGISLNRLDGFAVTRGPGSFTGLRIGLSSIKGLGRATGKPIVPVSSLKALATQVGAVPMAIFSLLDAYRKEVYLAGYRYEKDRLKRMVPEMVAGPEKLLAMVQGPAVFVGNGAVSYRRMLIENLGDSAYFAQDLHNTIHAATVARIALSQLESEGYDAAEIKPVYLRKSDAEINLE